MVLGLSHITFIAHDLDRAEAILSGVLDGRKVYDSGADTFSLSRERFFLVGSAAEPVWVAVMEGPPLEHRSYNHVAFRIAEEEYEDRLARVIGLGLDVREGRARVAGEGRSIYFHDDDNHLFELHTGTPEARLARYSAGRGE